MPGIKDPVTGKFGKRGPRGQTRVQEEQPRATRLRPSKGDPSNIYFIDPAWIPPGMDYNYKRNAILGQPDPEYISSMYDVGWTPVPASRHPFLMPAGTPGDAAIIRRGQTLCERPIEWSNEAKQEDYERATGQVIEKMRQIGEQPPPGTAPRTHPRLEQSVGVSYEPAPVDTEIVKS